MIVNEACFLEVGVAMDEQEERRLEMDQRVLRSKLINLSLDWELAALALDGQRYKTPGLTERESLRETSNVYRKCISELAEILGITIPTR